MDHVIVRNYLYKVRLNTIIDKVEDKDKIPTRITNHTIVVTINAHN